MTISAATGQVLGLNEALTQLIDHKGNSLKFEKQENGTYVGHGSDSDGYTFTYHLEMTQQPQYIVTVDKKKKGRQ